MNNRCVEPELLDELPATDPRAVHSRCDLRRINAWMGNARTVARCLESHQPHRVIELGAGDGTFLLAVARRLPTIGSGIQATLIDRQSLITPATVDAFATRGWSVEAQQADVFAWLENSPAQPGTVIIANLFLHHFSTQQLRQLLRLAAERSEALIACEPARSRWAVIGARLVWLIGCNAVTRHDAVVSVRAGFADRELTALWPETNGWELREGPVGSASHLFHARRNT